MCQQDVASFPVSRDSLSTRAQKINSYGSRRFASLRAEGFRGTLRLEIYGYSVENFLQGLSFNVILCAKMNLPQELVDMILNEINVENIKWRHLCHPRKRLRTLRSCALVARAFSRRSQMHLFSVVQLDMLEPEPAGLIAHFAELLSASPHIATYVRELSFQHTYGNAEHLAHILSSLPNLERIATVSAVNYDPEEYHEQAPWRYHHPLLKDAFLVAFARPTFRCIDLGDHEFSDATELDSVLHNSSGLEDVRLYRVAFKTRSPKTPTVPSSHLPRSVIKSLTVSAMDPADIMDLCTVVDFTRLKRLRLGNETAPEVLQILLRASERSLQELCILDTSHFHEQNPGPDILITGSTLGSLRSIYIHSPSVDYAGYTLRHFDSLSNLKALKTITLHLALFTDFRSFCSLYQWQWDVLTSFWPRRGKGYWRG
ncbi:hypothetical protein B0H17DRAFT_1177584 [Mycena rosella]|uniref:Uncharacterized protein n=1 Tax=Mycena rosella TaxID=1033263 RepID=A0AAD7DRD8_MYCRO|nr:hypothetical protein B0H17DRAFT_1177584 [Mycena rosella]